MDFKENDKLIDTQSELIFIASTLGATFNLPELEEITGKTKDEIIEELDSIIEAGILQKSENSEIEYSFKSEELKNSYLKNALNHIHANLLEGIVKAQFKKLEIHEKNLSDRKETLRYQTDILLSLTKNDEIREGNLEEALKVITEALSHSINVSRASIWEFDEKNYSITCLDLFERDENKHSNGVSLYGKDFPSYFKALDDEVVIKANNAHTDEYTYEFSEVYLKPLKIYSMLDVPFYVNGKLGGVICFEHQFNYRDWTFDEIMFTSSICAIISITYQSLQIKQEQKKTDEANQMLLTQNEELQQQQEEIMAQRDFIEKQNKKLKDRENQIASSIDAAKVIQHAILPQQQELEETFEENFVVFKAKDVVSGDFFWLKKVENYTYLAVVDCTGHGVPGAFMSLLGSVLLDKVIAVKGLVSPSVILESLHTEVKNLLRQETTGNQYGMDLIILKLENLPDSKVKLQFSGAKNPLYFIKANDTTLNTFKGSRKSVGGFQNEDRVFEDNEIILDKGSILYLGSDGLKDQNDKNRKRLGKSRLKGIIENYLNLPLASQKERIVEELNKQLEDTEQRDDILFMGIKL
ncbi:GAF domain-containing SpoIIE family protein phosphatase [Chondrinema litorale]|uniref:GAF domain-containing SpoIIE family protein phosphatase n=1 Tax=Chondrinema litorale TaxID=2994555 RepID=UPI0025439782|nr:SpoIIE family protein phosphatase [Chondrinema litorale]UZR96949.1 SpoIIE family protein phosphatase [Chondrinema litorale]